MSAVTARVLVVEDDQHIATLLTDSLREEGYEVRRAEHGRAALELTHTWRPDVIVLDLMMPVMDGWSFRAAQLARSDLADVPIVIVSAAYEIERRAEELGRVECIAKPFDLNEVLECVERILARSGSGAAS